MSHLKLQLFLFFLLLTSNLYIVHLIRKNLLELNHAMVWLLMDVVLILFTLFPRLWQLLADWFGIVEPVNVLFLFSTLLLLAFVFNLVIKYSKQSKRLEIIAQEMALLKLRVEKLNRQIDVES